MKIALRQAVESDLPFIFSTWLKGLYYGSPWWREMQKDVFFCDYHTVISNLLSRDGVQTIILCLSEDPDTILGYSVYTEKILHWVFVKKAFRKFGFSKQLIPTDVTTYTHLTKMGKVCLPEGWSFNPLLISEKDNESV